MIQIETVKAKLSIKTTNTKVSIQQPPPSFEMHTTQAKVRIEREPIQIKIDQSQCFNESGRMNNVALMEDNTSRSQQAHMEGMARVVSEGNQMTQIENGANMLAEIAYSDSFDIREYDLGTMPKSKPQINFVGGTMDIKVDDGYVQTRSNPNMPRIDYEVGGVDIQVAQQPSISINYVGENIDKTA